MEIENSRLDPNEIQWAIESIRDNISVVKLREEAFALILR